MVTFHRVEYLHQVDIAAPSQAVLSNTAFNSASKRHRPNLKIGQVVLCQVTAADMRFEIELSCEDQTTQKDWVTNEVYFGQLPEGGLLVPLSVEFSQRLLAKNCPIFPILGQHLKPFEMAVGANGRIYIKTGDSDNLRAVLVGQAITRSEYMTLEEVEKMCKEMENRLSHSG